MKKRILATLLSLRMVIGLLPVTALAAEDTQSITYIGANAGEPLKGAGTAEDPYRISSADDLNRIRYCVKETGIANTYKGEVPQKYERVVIDGHFKLTADIDLAGSTWVPIGWTKENKDFYAKTAFVGTFDGDGHTIKNLALGNYTPDEGKPTEYYGNGLFTRADGATIKNFTIDGVTTPDGNIGAYASAVVGILGEGNTFEKITVRNAEVMVANNFGFIFGDCWQYSTKDRDDFVVVKNCKVEDSKIHASGGTVGFIFGRNMNYNADVPLINDIQNCTVKNCTVEAAGGYVGGLWGHLCGGQVLECKAENVTVIQNCAEAKTQTSYAGVFGGAITGCTVRDCKASGSVTSNTWNIGGFAGSILVNENKASNIINCVADAEVEGKSYVGGFVGGATAGTFTNCQAKGNVTATQTQDGQTLMAGGFVGQLSGGTLTGCSATGNVTATESVALETKNNARNYRGVGGLVGNAYFNATETIIDCYATGNVSSNLYVGGLVGLPGDRDCLTVKNSYFCGTVKADDLYGVYYGKNTTGSSCYYPKLTEGFGYTNGGLFPNGVSHEEGELAIPKKSGYTFGGWYDNEGLTGDAVKNYKIDKTYYAKWVSEITFDANDGNLPEDTTNPVTVQENKNFTESGITLPEATRTGYTFKGWYTAQAGGEKVDETDQPSGNTILYARWEINKYAVTFKDGDTTLSTQTVEHGSKATMPVNPTKKGYAFSGWYTNSECTEVYDFSTSVTGALTLTAKWTPIQESTTKFTVTFNSTGGSAVVAADVYEGAVVAEPAAPTREGYTFAGWLNGTAPYNFNAPVTAPLTLTAEWNEKTYTVTWDVDGETTTEKYTYGAEITLPTAPTKNGYRFTGWSGYSDGMTMPAGDVTFTAQWKKIHSSGSSSSSEKTYAVSTEKSKNGSVKLSDAKAVKGDTVTITVKPEDGYVLDTLTVIDADGDEVKLKDKGDGKYTFTMPASKITVEATFVLAAEVEQPTQPTAHPFADIAADTWIDTAVQYVYANGLMTGVSETEFAPSAATSRAMIWTILARRSGADTTGGANWYEKGQQWAIETGLMTGNGSGTLAPKAGATRAETAAMLMRFYEANQ